MRSALLALSAAFLGALGLAGSLRASPVPVTNNSFEADGQVCCGHSSGLTGWTFGGGNGFNARGTQDQAPNNPTGTDGSYWAFINLDPGDYGLNTLTTSSPVTTIQPNTTYTLTVALGNNHQTNGYFDPGNMYASLYAGSGADLGTTGALEGTVPNSTFVDYTVSYTSGAAGTDPNVGQRLYIQLAAQRPTPSNDPYPDTGYQPLFDNVRLDATPVPEPASVSIVALGAGAALLGRRRR